MSFVLLGILNAQASGVAAAPAYDLLETEILTGAQASVTFSSLNSTYGADYQHLQLRMTARTDRSLAIDNMRISFNGSSSGYATHWLLGDGSSVTSSNLTSQTYIELYRAAGNTAASDIFSANVVDILDPFESTKATTIRSLGGLLTTTQEVRLQSGLWTTTSAVDSINITSGFNFVIGCRFSLYGLRSA